MATTFTWAGSAGDGWYDLAAWSPTGPPGADDTAIIDTLPAPSVNAGDPSVDGVTIEFGNAGATLILNGGTIGRTTTLLGTWAGTNNLNVHAASELDGTFAFADGLRGGKLQVNHPTDAALTIGGTATLTASAGNEIILQPGPVTLDGLIAADGGSLYVQGTTLSGSGTISIGRGGTFWTDMPTDPSQTVRFEDNTGLIVLSGSGAIGGTIINFQPGDRLLLENVIADNVDYDTNTGLLTVSNAGTVVANMTIQSDGSPLSFATGFAMPAEAVDTMITSSAASRVWNGSNSNDWFDPANWTSTPDTPPGHPVAGDTVTINSGTVIIDSSDILQNGAIDSQRIILAGDSAAPPALILSDAVIGTYATIVATGSQLSGLLRIAGHTTLGGVIAAEAPGGGMTIDLVGGADLIGTTSSSVLNSSHSSLKFVGAGTFINDGIIVNQGGLLVGAGVTVTTTGTDPGIIRLQQGGAATIEGGIESGVIIEFGDTSGFLRLANVSNFFGSLSNVGPGNRIDFADLDVGSVAYSAPDDTLTLFDPNGNQIGQPLTIFTVDGADGFSLAPDGKNGTLLTYTPNVHSPEQALPIPLVAAPGATVALTDLLIQSFGSIPAQWTQYGLSAMSTDGMSAADWSYWDPSSPLLTGWVFDGTDVPPLPTYPYLPPTSPVATVVQTEIDKITLQVGNNIGPDAFLTIPIGLSPVPTDPTSNLTYNIQPIDPAVASPTIGSGIVDPGDIVTSAQRFAAYYTGVSNAYDCAFIADAVAAGAGAPMPPVNLSTDPSANQEGGFWRIAYRGSDQANPVADWSSLVQAGDIVRMAWLGGFDGQHTTTVLGKNGDGTIEVYDNVAPTISIHSASYWVDTLPSSITIYRLDPNHQYLINGTSASEFLQGTVFNDLIRPNGGVDALAGGAGDNEFQGTAATMHGISILDWKIGDTIDITDLDPTGASFGYDTGTGVLTVGDGGAQTVAIRLSANLSGAFTLAADGTGGTEVAMVACFATGTRLATPAGAVAVENLCVGDRLRTIGDAAAPEREIIWIGRRRIDLRRHAAPDTVRPVRIAPHAFGPGCPARPLVLSPDHALFLDGALIPVRCLVDGRLIRPIDTDAVTYWHVELTRHDVILAEDLPVESYLETGQRSAFQNAGPVVQLHPAFTAWSWEAQSCAPLTVTGPTVALHRARLAERAEKPAVRRDACAMR
ncbi:MAG: Hint domain-containing protein [Acetobacteraceae bacterium]